VYPRRTQNFKIGFFGASTGAAAALITEWAQSAIAAAQRPEVVGAIVSRGGRPDLALQVLEQVKAPVLLIVGGNDPVVIALNKQALARLRSEAELVIIPGASHLFEEPGTLEAAAQLARDWFLRHLTKGLPDTQG
jgi:pimeloyl-ACP methyl ester carboxylesterase